jgi:hypothetical protein
MMIREVGDLYKGNNVVATESLLDEKNEMSEARREEA